MAETGKTRCDQDDQTPPTTLSPFEGHHIKKEEKNQQKERYHVVSFS